MDETYNSLQELLFEVFWDWDRPYPITKRSDGNYNFNKLTVTPEWSEYKGNYVKLTPKIWEKFQQWADLTIKLTEEK